MVYQWVVNGLAVGLARVWSHWFVIGWGHWEIIAGLSVICVLFRHLILIVGLDIWQKRNQQSRATSFRLSRPPFPPQCWGGKRGGAIKRVFVVHGFGPLIDLPQDCFPLPKTAFL
jgi:hypothetical protein